MSLASNITTAFTRVATEFKAIRTLISGSGTGNISGLTTTDKSSLVAAINEARASSGSTTLSALTDTTISAPATGHLLRYDGATSKWVNVLGGTYYQAQDADLDAIAALATTAYGRALLTLANQAGLMGLLLSATATVQGIVELATDPEAIAGADTVRAVTPANVAAVFTNRIATSTALGTSNTLVPSQGAVKAYADSLLGANDAMVYKGVINASTNPNYPAADAGHTYKVSAAGKIGGAAGPNVEIGDMLICTTDGTAAGTQAAVGANWTIVQTNIDGAVTGPGSAVSNNFASFSGTTGKVIADSGISIDTDGTLAANSATRVPAQSAVRTYIANTNYTKTEIGDPETDFAAAFVAALA